MTHKLRTAVGAVMLAAVGVLAADVAVFPPTVTNLTQGQGDAVGAVLSQQYAKVSSRSVIGPAETRAALDVAESQSEAAKALEVNEYIKVNLVALASKILVEAERCTQSGSPIYRAEATAMSLDDMEEVCDRMARSLFSKTPLEETMDLENVTEKEATERNRLFAEKVMGLKTSLIYALAADEKIQPMATIGFDGRLEGKRYFLEFGVAGMFPTRTHDESDSAIAYGGVNFEIGGDYYIVNHKYVSPYIGGGVSPRLVVGGPVGFAGYLQTGIMFLRVSSMRVYFDVRAMQNALPLTWNRYESLMGQDKEIKFYPTELTFEVGIGW
jgi:hypothetical protein